MSLAHELRVLDIESQTELLDRLRLLTRFGSNLTNITGPDGAGKSWVAQRYLEAWAQDKNQSLLMCHPNQSDAQKRTILLNQLVSHPLFNENDAIPDSFVRMVGDEACDIVVVVDDAQLLSEALLAELWGLVLLAQNNAAWNINVVLFTSGSGLDAVLSRLSYGQETKPLALELEPFSTAEVEMFMELLVLKYVSGEDEKKRVRNRVKKTPPLPGALMALGESKVERRIIIRSIIGSPLKIAILVLFLLLLIAAGYFWLFNQSGPLDKENDLAAKAEVEQTVIPTIATEDVKVAVSQESKSSNDEETSSEVVVDDSSATSDDFELSPEIATNVATVGNDDEGQRVVVPSTVVDALLEGEAADTQVIDDAVELARQEQKVPVAETEFERDIDAPPLVTFSFSKQELMSVSDRNYTLQIAALQSLGETQEFIDKYGIADIVRIYPTYRGDAQWFIVTYKDFATIQAARDARTELPAAVQELEPWAKSMLQVHREIERAN